MHRTGQLIALVAVAALIISSCGSSSTSSSTSGAKTRAKAVDPNAQEKSPPGDIPDSTQFVRFNVPAGGFSITVPEGWAQTHSGSKITFTSNLNSVQVDHHPATAAPTAAAVKSKDVQTLAQTLKGFHLQSVARVNRSNQTAVRIKYLAKSASNSVTGKSVTDAAERYVFVRNGKEAIITLAGPNGADNVDAWRTMSNSLKWAQ
ncbi:MAG TPA: APA family fibronectin-binding glycoprotein [Thermoleophilaceae bacterium]|jgi:hypothetical protein|nr:APA family fibronectin-binding glycoprotein [Thermoleophilaceae bacterium]